MVAPQYKILVAADTHPGMVRTQNEDSVLTYLRPPGSSDACALLIVADGMGGHMAGEVASQLAVDTIFNDLKPFLESTGNHVTKPLPSDFDTDETRPIKPVPNDQASSGSSSQLEQRLESAVHKANTAIHRYSTEHLEDARNLGCTLTAALIQDDVAAIAHVGDSRAYHLSNGAFWQITNDHSYVGELVRSGHIQPEEVFTHPQRNVVTRALGVMPQVEVEMWTELLEPGDRLMLCSDGLWEMIPDSEQIAALLDNTHSLEASVESLIRMANQGGGQDNIGVVAGELVKI